MLWASGEQGRGSKCVVHVVHIAFRGAGCRKPDMLPVLSDGVPINLLYVSQYVLAGRALRGRACVRLSAAWLTLDARLCAVLSNW
jgi:hypothetical protein